MENGLYTNFPDENIHLRALSLACDATLSRSSVVKIRFGNAHLQKYRNISKMCYNFNGIINTGLWSSSKMKVKTITLRKKKQSHNISPQMHTKVNLCSQSICIGKCCHFKPTHRFYIEIHRPPDLL